MLFVEQGANVLNEKIIDWHSKKSNKFITPIKFNLHCLWKLDQLIIPFVGELEIHWLLIE